MASEDDDRAAGHVLARVVADPLDDRDRAGVADGEPLARRAGAEELAAGRAVEHRVPDEARLARIARGRRDHDPAARHRLADVVVRLADELQLDTRGEERAEALPGGPLEARPDAAGGWSVARDARDRAAEPGADRAVGVRDLVGGLDEPRPADRGLALRGEERAEPIALVRHRLADVARRPTAETHEQPVELERVRCGIAGAPLPEQVGAADGLVDGAEAECREVLSHLERDEAEVGLDHLRRPRELRAQLGPLARDPDGARVEVAGAHHEAALGEEKRRAERELVGAEERGEEHVAAGLEAAVDPDPHPAAKPVRDERLLCLGEAELPRCAGVLDRGERARARAAVRARRRGRRPRAPSPRPRRSGRRRARRRA